MTINRLIVVSLLLGMLTTGTVWYFRGTEVSAPSLLILILVNVTLGLLMLKWYEWSRRRGGRR